MIYEKIQNAALYMEDGVYLKQRTIGATITPRKKYKVTLSEEEFNQLQKEIHDISFNSRSLDGGEMLGGPEVFTSICSYIGEFELVLGEEFKVEQIS